MNCSVRKLELFCGSNLIIMCREIQLKEKLFCSVRKLELFCGNDVIILCREIQLKKALYQLFDETKKSKMPKICQSKGDCQLDINLIFSRFFQIFVILLLYIIWNSSTLVCGVRVPADTRLPRTSHRRGLLCLKQNHSAIRHSCSWLSATFRPVCAASIATVRT